MLHRAQKLLLFAAAILPAAFAQTTSSCDPLQGCRKDDPALGTTYTWDFANKQSAAPRWSVISSGSRISYENDGMHMRVQAKGDSPTIQSDFYIFWGRIDVVMKAAPGQGIVSSLVYQSDDLDEIDVEFVGSQPDNVQTNIFSKGDETVHIYGGNSPVNDAVDNFHTYTVDWTDSQIVWYIDGTVARTLTSASLGTVYPQTPMQLKIGPWAAGDPSNPPGTIQWAGGPIIYSQAPFDMVVQSITVTDYSTGATIYRYTDNSGSSSSIEIVEGSNPAPSSSSSTPASSSTTSSSIVSSSSTTTSAVKSSTTSSVVTTTSSVVTTTSSVVTTPSTTSSVVPSTTSATPSSTSTKEVTTTSSEATTTKSLPSSSSTEIAKSTFVIVSVTTTSASSSKSSSGSPSTTFQTSTVHTSSSSSTASSSPTVTPSDNGASVTQISWSLLSLTGIFMLML